MLYLTGCVPKNLEKRALLLEKGFGVMMTPYSVRSSPGAEWKYAADNGCFSNRWEEKVWLRWLQKQRDPASALFATVPDVVANHEATLERWHKYSVTVRELGFRTAFVLQDGATTSALPLADIDAIFIGGSTRFKLSSDCQAIVSDCKKKGKWIHMGRVNSQRRMQTAFQWGCDSVDGTYLAFSPDANTSRLIRFKENATQPLLFSRH